MPQSFFIDRNGIVRETVARGLEYDEMLAIVRSAIGTSATNLSSN